MKKRLPKPIFEKSREGKIGYSFSESRFSDDLISIDKNKLRNEIKGFPELSEVEITRHYTNLSHLNHSVDSGFYPLGSCTMKYSPKINEKIANFEGFNAHPYSPHNLVQGNLELMRNLSGKGGGSSRFISSREEMEKIFGSDLDRTFVPTARNLNMKLEFAGCGNTGNLGV